MDTEERNPRTQEIDIVPTLELVRLINEEDRKVAPKVAEALPQIAAAIDEIASRMREGGRLFYIGAGTSGRLGVLDAVECVPTYGVDPSLVQGILAGGHRACHTSIETAEDDPAQGEADLRKAGLTARDAVVGIAASGRTPYTRGGVQYARRIGALTVAVSCNQGAPMSMDAEFAVEVATDAEVIAGSTRMKAGTAQKMVLNMISTGVMIRLGHVFQNLMVNVHLKNSKLLDRGTRIVCELTGAPRERASEVLADTGDVRTAVVAIRLGLSGPEAARRVRQADGSLRRALREGGANES